MNKKQTTEECRRILKKYALSKENLEFKDSMFLYQVLFKHPESKSKIGCGVVSFNVVKNKKYPSTNNFVLVRKDGTSTDFSFMKCLLPQSLKKDFYKACRSAIEYQTQAFRNKLFADTDLIKCPISGVMCDSKNTHIDHDNPSFKELVDDYIKIFDVKITKEMFRQSKDNEIGVVFTDMNTKRFFRKYHLYHANLVAISKTENLKKH